MRFSGFIGIILAFGILIGDISLAGDIFSFIYLPAVIVCIFGTIGLSYLSYGALDTLKALRSMTLLVTQPPEQDSASLERHAEVLRGCISHLYACGVAGTMISLLKMLAFAASKNALIWGLAATLVSCLPIFYAVLGAEFLLRPASHRLQGLARGQGLEY